MEEEKLKDRKAKALKNPKGNLVRACKDLAEYYCKHERFNDAISEYELLASLCDNVKPSSRLKCARYRSMIGEVYLQMNDFDKALKYMKQHLTVAIELKNLTHELEAMEAISRIYLDQATCTSNKAEINTLLKAAEEVLIQSLTKCESRSRTSCDISFTRACLLLNMNILQERFKLYDKGIEYIKKARMISIDQEFYGLVHESYLKESFALERKGEFNEALQCLNKALDMTYRLNNKYKVDKIYETLDLKALVLCKMSNYEGAKQMLSKAWKLEALSEDKLQKIEFKLKIVIAMCDTEESIKTSGTSDHNTLKTLYKKMGDGASCLRLYAGAVEYYLKWLAHAKLAGDSGMTLSPVYRSIHNTYSRMKRYDKTLEYLEEYKILIKDNPRKASNVRGYIAVALFRAQKPYQQVEKACLDARSIAKECNKKKYEIRVLKNLLDFQEAYGETDKMENTRAELQALGYDDYDNLEYSEDEESGDYEVTTKIGADVRLEDRLDLSDDRQAAYEGAEKYTNLKNAKGETYLHRACIRGIKRRVKDLLSQRHPVDVRDNAGRLPLHIACERGLMNIARLLIEAGSDVNDRRDSKYNGSTPLHDAAVNGHLHVIQLLLEHNAIPNLKNDHGETPLDALQKWKQQTKVKFTKEQEILYKYICYEINNFNENTGGANIDASTSKSKTVGPIKDVSLIPSTSRMISNISLPGTSGGTRNMQEMETLIVDDSVAYDNVINSQNEANQSELPSDTMESAIIAREVRKEKLDKNKNGHKKSKRCTPLIEDNYKITRNVNKTKQTESQKRKRQISPQVSDSEVVLQAEKSMVQKRRKLNNSSITNTCSTDTQISKSKTSVKDMPLSKTSEVISNVSQYVAVDEVIDCDEYPEVDYNNYNATLLNSKDEVFEDLIVNSLPAVANKPVLDNPVNATESAEINAGLQQESSESIEQNETRVRYMNENSFESDQNNKNPCPRIIEVKSLLNCRDSESNKKYKNLKNNLRYNEQIMSKAVLQIKRDYDVLSNCGNNNEISINENKEQKDMTMSENPYTSSDGLHIVEDTRPNIKQEVNVVVRIHEMNLEESLKKEILPLTAVKVFIEDEELLITLDSDTINTSTISWLVGEIRCKYYTLKGTYPVFELRTSDGAILPENAPLSEVLSSLELRAVITNWKTLPADERYREGDWLDIDDAETVCLFPLHDDTPQHTTPHSESPRPKIDESPRPNSPHSDSASTSLRPKCHESVKSTEGPQATSYSESLQATSPRSGYDAALLPLPPENDEPVQSTSYAESRQPPNPQRACLSSTLPTKLTPCAGSSTALQDLVTSQFVTCDEPELDDDILQLLGDAPKTETLLGPPIHTAVARRWQEILATGLAKEVTDEIVNEYSVPSNCKMLLAPSLNPEVKDDIHDNVVKLDSSLMKKQKQLGLAISALGTVVNSIISDEKSKKILKPISDACRLLCDLHYHETETRRRSVIDSANPELQDLLVQTARGNQLFGDDIVTEKIENVKYK